MASMLDKFVLASRHILSVFFLGLMAALVLYAARFLLKLWAFATEILSMTDEDALLKMLYMLDSALVAALVATVAIASYHAMVRQLPAGTGGEAAAWVDDTAPGNLKLKLATSIVAISSIHLLTMLMKPSDYSDRDVWLALALHGSFLMGVLILGVLDWLESRAKK